MLLQAECFLRGKDLANKRLEEQGKVLQNHVRETDASSWSSICFPVFCEAVRVAVLVRCARNPKARRRVTVCI